MKIELNKEQLRQAADACEAANLPKLAKIFVIAIEIDTLNEQAADLEKQAAQKRSEMKHKQSMIDIMLEHLPF